MTTPDAVLEFWFPADQALANKMWWGKDPELDARIGAQFGATLAAAKRGELDAWAQTANGRIALILVLDQLSRNIHRGEAETYAADAQAVALVLEGLDRGHDRELPPQQRLFFYMPLEHAEDLGHQERCVELVRALAKEVAADPEANEAQRKTYANFVDYAIRHRDIVARFGRFPHRNVILGRTSTEEELAFLQQPNSSF